MNIMSTAAPFPEHAAAGARRAAGSRERHHGHWGTAWAALALAVLAPAIAAALTHVSPPLLGAALLIGGWVLAGSCTLLAVGAAIHALGTLPPAPHGRITCSLGALALFVGGLDLVAWVGMSLYIVFFVLVVPALLALAG
jgi:hypothetical protein